MAKQSKHLVPVGTHIPTATKLGLQAIAESENKSIYEVLQDMIQEKVDKFEFDINALKKGESKNEELESSDDGSDLLA